MTDTNNPIKEIIDERINNLYGDENKEDLSYVDLFYPKIELLLGLNGCISIYNNEDPIKVFENVGLTKEDYESITSLINEGLKINKEDSSLEVLSEIDKRSDIVLVGYLNKVRDFKIKNNVSYDEINKFDSKVNVFFGNNPSIFTACSNYEIDINKIMN